MGRPDPHLQGSPNPVVRVVRLGIRECQASRISFRNVGSGNEEIYILIIFDLVFVNTIDKKIECSLVSRLSPQEWRPRKTAHSSVEVPVSLEPTFVSVGISKFPLKRKDEMIGVFTLVSSSVSETAFRPVLRSGGVTEAPCMFVCLSV